MGEVGVDGLPIWSQISFLIQCDLQCTNFLNISDKESVFMSAVMSMLWGSRERSKQRQSSQDYFAHFAFDAALISWMAGL